MDSISEKADKKA